jgi:UDP-3-O-[3-hydroxymyristoyl] glucosamine N-acyltransferase
LFLLKEIAELVSGELVGDGATELHGLSSIEDAVAGDLSFVLYPKIHAKAGGSSASAFVSCVPLDISKPYILVAHSKDALATLTSWWSKRRSSNIPASYGQNVSIGAGCVVGHGCIIGDDVVLHDNVVLYPFTEVGNRVEIHSGSVIGSDGFGYYFKDGKHNKIIHIGKVVLEDDVEIGANTTIDRGCLGETRIGCGTKIDNLVQIGHNVRVGKHCVVASQVGIVGSASVGNYVTIGGQVGISAVKVGDHAIIAAKSGVTKDISSGMLVSGFPAQDHRKELSDMATLKRFIKNNNKKVGL